MSRRHEWSPVQGWESSCIWKKQPLPEECMWNSISSFYIRYEVSAKVSITGYDDKNWEIQICPLCKTLYCDDLATLICLWNFSKAGATFHSGRANCASGRNLSLTLTFLLLRLCVKRKQSFVLLFLEKILFSHESTSSWASMFLMRRIIWNC